MSSPLDPLKQLAERLKDESAKVGLTLHSFAVFPSVGQEGMPDIIQATFSIDMETIGKDEEQIAIDRAFSGIIGSNAEIEKEQELIDARQELAKRIAKGENFLGE